VFGPDDVYDLYLGSVRSGWFRSSTNPPSFSAITQGISPHAYGRVVFLPGDSNTLISSGGRYMNLSNDGGETWRFLFLTDPVTGGAYREGLTGLAIDETSVWLADVEGNIWESLDHGETYSHITVLPVDIGSSKHGETPDEIEPWMYEGPSLVYLGDDVLLMAWDGQGLWRSDDRGTPG